MDNGHISGNLTNGLTNLACTASLFKPTSDAAKLTFQQENCVNLQLGMKSQRAQTLDQINKQTIKTLNWTMNI